MLGDTMNDTNYKVYTITYRAIEALLPLFGILLLILSLTIDTSYKNVLLVIAIVLIVLSIGYAFLATYLVNRLKNRYKELVISDAFTARNFLYFSRQKGIDDKNKYSFSQAEFEGLNFFKGNDSLTYFKNDLVVGDIRNVDFRSMNYAYLTGTNKKSNFGRIYSLNLKSDNNFELLITKNNEKTNLTKLDLKLRGYNFYSNDPKKALEYIINDKFETEIEKIENYGPLFMKVLNGSLYLIIDKKETFETENRTYNDICDDLEREILILNCIIESFKFTPNKPKVKEMKIK